MKTPLIVLALVTACASKAAPRAAYAAAEGSVRAARAGGAASVPDAAVHLDLAEAELVRAQRLLRDHDDHAAAWVAARARSDAELASALAREAQARALADQTTAEVREAQASRRSP